MTKKKEKREIKMIKRLRDAYVRILTFGDLEVSDGFGVYKAALVWQRWVI